ncbi:hypothetical protein JW960_26765 [candidate division KSB1 bacterium]|nr:hypothetical protein [candidate division KSB1 bacterium]
MNEITLNIPKKMLFDILHKLPEHELEELLNEFKNENEQSKQTKSIEILESLNGIISVGGDAVIDTEQLYDENNY